MESSFHFKLERCPPIISIVLEARGWSEFNENSLSPNDWSLFWKSGRPKPSEFSNGLPYQKYNHFPKTSAICRKDTLCRNLRKMRALYGAVYNFFPQTFMLPQEYGKFVNEYMQHEHKPIWISKPNDLSRGRKIFLFRELTDLIYDTPVIVQKYISQPLLISRYKWDMRVYVLITSYHPLTIYIYREGLARFSTEPYNTESLDNKFVHLTNSSINKLSPNLMTHKDVVGTGCKWDFATLNSYLERCGMDVKQIWKKIESIVILTLLMLVPVTPDIHCCFELLGFDIMLDANLKPWLLEVNSSPALAVDSEIDARVKTLLINDIVDLLNFQHPSDYWAVMEKKEIERVKKFRTLRSIPKLSVLTSRLSETAKNVRSLTAASTSKIDIGIDIDLDQTIKSVDTQYKAMIEDITREHLLKQNRNQVHTESKSGNFDLIFPRCHNIEQNLQSIKNSMNSRNFQQVCSQNLSAIIAKLREDAGITKKLK